MLTAITKTGKKICLAYNYNKATLVHLRNHEEFLCPVCGEDVTLKLGNERIFHFAHKRGGTCLEWYENETMSHVEGKRQLYQWLNRQKISSVLEFFDKGIQQRPDIMFKLHERKFALEYQCSMIPENVFIKRTENYLQNGYIPLWILDAKHLHIKKRNLISLSNFHYFFLRSSYTGSFFIPCYCPEQQHFHLIKSIVPVSTKNALCEIITVPLQKIHIESFFEISSVYQFNLIDWKKELDHFLFNWSRYVNSRQKSFLHEIYINNLNPILFPPEIGLPVSRSIFIQTPPVIWQTYLFLDVLAHKEPNDIITVKEISHQFHKRMQRKEIAIRTLPQMANANPLVPVLEYFGHLEQLGIVRRRNATVFQVLRKFIIPRTNREKEEAKERFFKMIKKYKF